MWELWKIVPTVTENDFWHRWHCQRDRPVSRW
jgi:hypothetical protein